MSCANIGEKNLKLFSITVLSGSTVVSTVYKLILYCHVKFFWATGPTDSCNDCEGQSDVKGQQQKNKNEKETRKMFLPFPSWSSFKILIYWLHVSICHFVFNVTSSLQQYGSNTDCCGLCDDDLLWEIPEYTPLWCFSPWVASLQESLLARKIWHKVDGV